MSIERTTQQQTLFFDVTFALDYLFITNLWLIDLMLSIVSFNASTQLKAFILTVRLPDRTFFPLWHCVIELM